MVKSLNSSELSVKTHTFGHAYHIKQRIQVVLERSFVFCILGNIKHMKSSVSNCSFASEMEVDLIQLLSTGGEPLALHCFPVMQRNVLQGSKALEL